MNRAAIKYVLLAFAVMLLSACEKNSQTFTPLPKAWPRIPVTVSDSMVSIVGTPVEVAANPAARINLVKGETSGLTVTYPQLRAHIYYTFIPVTGEQQRAEVLDARKQRISLNLNGTDAMTVRSQGEIPASMVIARGGTQTPAQLLASFPDWVVSATVFIEDERATVAYDSVLPVIEVLKHDLARSLPAVKFATI